jgi:6-phosphogluconolactonase
VAKTNGVKELPEKIELKPEYDFTVRGKHFREGLKVRMIQKRILENPKAVTLEAVRLFEHHALKSIQARGRFCVALAGGSTPKAIYERLAKLELAWDKIHLFWGDERCVPPDDSRSNFAMVNSALLERIHIPHENVHRMRGELGGQAGAAAYKAELEVMFDDPITLDLVHLGLGPDGHTASLFPSTPDWDSLEPVRVTFPGPTLEPQVERISLGFSVLNSARAAHFFVTGPSKAQIVSELWGGVYPADHVHTPDTLWLLDRDAAALLTA